MYKWNTSMKFKILFILLLVFISKFSTAQADLIFKNSFEYIVIPLNDTGITRAGGALGGNTQNCMSDIVSPQDCNVGRDFTHDDDSDGHAGFSFVKLDASGIPLVDQSVDYATTPWSCVKDNITGLIWEVKNETVNSIHYKDITYRWGGITAIGLNHPSAEGVYYDDWDILINGSNTENLCGFDNWRVPKVEELSGLSNQATSFPAIDTNYFPHTESNAFWSSSPIIAHNDYTAWTVYFDNGFVLFNNRDSGVRLRLVSSP